MSIDHKSYAVFGLNRDVDRNIFLRMNVVVQLATLLQKKSPEADVHDLLDEASVMVDRAQNFDGRFSRSE